MHGYITRAVLHYITLHNATLLFYHHFGCCTCHRVCVCTCERISISVTGFMWLISVAAVVRVTTGFQITVRSLSLSLWALWILLRFLPFIQKREKRNGPKKWQALRGVLCTHIHRRQPESERIRENVEQNKRWEERGKEWWEMDWEERGLRQTRSDGSWRRRSGWGDERDRGGGKCVDGDLSLCLLSVN